MNKAIYTEPRTFEKYDNTRFMVYLNQEVIPDYVPEVFESDNKPDRFIGCAWFTWCKCGASKKKNPPKDISGRGSSTQSRGRTGTGCPTGV